MKHVLGFAISLFVSTFIAKVAYTQQIAVTDTGEQVYLYNDGTWKYISEPQSDDAIPINDIPFTTPEDASFRVRSTINNLSVFINPGEWSFNKATSNPAAEYEFKLKGKDVYAMAITEEIEIGMENLVEIALNNAKGFAPDTRVVEKEYRTVNGKKVLYLSMEGTGNGIAFQYFGYYYSDEAGSTQLVVYTGKGLVKKYQTEIFDLLNGFSIGN